MTPEAILKDGFGLQGGRSKQRAVPLNLAEIGVGN